MRILWRRHTVYILHFVYIVCICFREWSSRNSADAERKSWEEKLRGVKRNFQTLLDLTTPDARMLSMDQLCMNHSFTSPKNENQKAVPPEVIIVINTTPGEVVERDSIRKTWLQWTQQYPVKAVFFMGITDADDSLSNDLQMEQSLHNDLVLVHNFREGYYRLTLKTLLILQWYTQVYTRNHEPPHPTFLVKADSDIFLNIPLLMTTLASKETREFYDRNGYYLGGRLWMDAVVNNDPNSKFYISPDLWLLSQANQSYYPPYMNGPAYILSTNVLNRVYQAALSHPIFPMEDVFLTGYVMRESLNMTVAMDLTNLTLSVPPTNIDAWEASLGDASLVFRNNIVVHPVNSVDLMARIYKLMQ